MKIMVCNDGHEYHRYNSDPFVCISSTYIYSDFPGQPPIGSSSEFAMMGAHYFGRAIVINLRGVSASFPLPSFAVIATSPLHPGAQYSARFNTQADAIAAWEVCRKCLRDGEPLPGIELEATL